MGRVEAALTLIGELSRAATVSQAIDVFERAIEPFGVKVYRTSLLANPERGYVDAAVVSNWADEWLAFYRGTRAFMFDPVVAACMKGEGFFWRDLPGPRTSFGKTLMRDAQEFGMVDGFTAIRSPRGELKSAVHLSGEQLEWTELEQGVVTLIANTLMSRVLFLRDIQLAPAMRALSPREVQVLHHAALGHCDKQIARSTGIAHETIRSYWKSIRTKLGASDRANAVAIALWAGKIAP